MGLYAVPALKYPDHASTNRWPVRCVLRKTYQLDKRAGAVHARAPTATLHSCLIYADPLDVPLVPERQPDHACVDTDVEGLVSGSISFFGADCRRHHRLPKTTMGIGFGGGNLRYGWMDVCSFIFVNVYIFTVGRCLREYSKGFRYG